MNLHVRSLHATDTVLLDQFVSTEAVIPVRDPDDLQRRLAPDRRVFTVLAPDDEPLGFVQVAITRAFPQRLHGLLHGPVEADRPRFGVFYGITRVSPRARGEAGHFLEAAMAELLRDLPDLTLATFSPMPGFARWAREQGLDPKALDRLGRESAAGLATADAIAHLHALGGRYLAARDAQDRILDPVARFHLGNGAALRAIIVGADGSWHGLEQSHGVMASYQYHPALGSAGVPSRAA